MSALRLLVRRSIRSNRRAVLGLALVVALAGGVSLTSIAAARRTASTFERYQEASRASDVALNIVARAEMEDESSAAPSPRIHEAARRLPGVASAASYVGLESVGLLDDDGELLPIQPEVIGSIDGRFLVQDRVAVSEGRLPAPDRLEEVFVNHRMAEHLRARIGSVVHLAVASLSALSSSEGAEVEVLGTVEGRIVGIGQFPDEVLGDDFDGSDRVLVTPAFTRRWQDVAGSYVWQGLRLSPGTSVDRAIVDYQGLLPPDLKVNVQRSDVQRERVQRAVRPVVVALGAFGAAALLATLALGALGIVRLVAASRGDARTLRAVGLGPGATAVVLGVAAGAAAALGTAGAVVLAWALSPLAPVGPVRQVEPDRGTDLDATVLLLGGGALLLLLLVAAAVSARQGLAAERRGADPVARPSRLLARLAALGLGPAAVVGARHALGEGRRGGPPARSTVAACTVAVAALAAALTFGASVRSLVSTPTGYGWPATAAIQAGGGYDALDLAAVPGVAELPQVRGLTVAGFGPVVVAGQRVNAMGIRAVEGRPAVSVVRGRVPRDDHEVALGASTARRLGVAIGDRLVATGGDLRVTGIVALPAIGPLASAHPSLGQGALLTLAGLARQDDSTYASLAFVQLGHPTIRPGDQRLLGRIYATLTGGPADGPEVHGVQRPSEVVGLQPASRTANLLAGLLAAAAVLALALSLSASVRRRRRTFAILSALGFSRGDLRRTVRWQSNLVMAVALLVGLPVGVAGGRLAWTAFAEDLGAASGPRVPVLLLAATAVGVLVVANVVGEVPAHVAAGRRADRSLAEHAAIGGPSA